MNNKNTARGAADAFLRFGAMGLYKTKDEFSFLRILARQYDTLPLICVRDTLRVLDAIGETECLAAVRAVYFENIRLPIKKNEISYRVRSFAFKMFIDDRTVYRRLERAGKIWLSLMEKRSGERAA